MSASAKPKWDPLYPEVHVPADPGCDCYAYTPEGRAGIERGREDVRAGRVFRAGVSDFEALMNGQMTIHDLHLREFLAAAEGVMPQELETTP